MLQYLYSGIFDLPKRIFVTVNVMRLGKSNFTANKQCTVVLELEENPAGTIKENKYAPKNVNV